MQVFQVIEDLTSMLSSDDLDCSRNAALALGNVIVELDARDKFLQIPMVSLCDVCVCVCMPVRVRASMCACGCVYVRLC